MTPNLTTDNTNQGGGSDDQTSKVSLYIAIAALAISSLLAFVQLLFSYVTASPARNKTNAAALGGWSKYTHHGFHEFWKGRLHVTYGVMELSQKAFVDDYLARQVLNAERLQEAMKHLKGYDVQGFVQSACLLVFLTSDQLLWLVRETKNGSEVLGESLRLVHANTPDRRTEVDESELTPTQRAAWKRIQGVSQRKQPGPSIASWVTLSQH
jgi:hypothetical protein